MGDPRDDLKYQLVFEFPATSAAEFDKLLELEDEIDEELAEIDDAFVDGNDFGTGVFHLFLHTDRPEEMFSLVQEFLEAHRPGTAFAAGYRDVNEDNFKGLWPVGSTFELK